jgi:hypothetical protein
MRIVQMFLPAFLQNPDILETYVDEYKRGLQESRISVEI